MTATKKSRLPLERGGALQRKTLMVLAAGTILGGLGVGASLSVGALLLAEVSGSPAISGLASALFNLGAALAGIPLAKLAARKGRRRAIVTGNSVATLGGVTAVLGAGVGAWPVLALGILVLGVASAVQLLARFTATDLAHPAQRARDLSLVVWSITIGAVVGPNLMGPGAWIGEQFGLTPLAGVFVFTIGAQMLAAAVSFVGLRPDPLLVARSLPEAAAASGRLADAPVVLSRRGQLSIIGMIAVAQAVMVGLMAMAPLHIMGTGGTHEMVGVTLSLHIAGMYAFSPLFGMLAGKIGRFGVVHLGWVILLMSVGLAFVAHESHLIMEVSMTLLGVGWGAVTVAGAALITEHTAETVRTKRQGQSDTFMSASGATAGVLAGIGFAMGGYQLLAWLGTALVVVGIVLTMSVIREVRRLRQENQAEVTRVA